MKSWCFFWLTIFFIQVLLSASTSVELPGILKPHLIEVDEKNLFLVEETSVFIYSLSDFKLLKRFGRRGEGPGDLKGYISAIEVQPDYILVNSMGRLSWFKPNGDFIRQQNDTTLGHNYKILGNRYTAMRMIRGKDTIYLSVSILDSKLKIIKELHRYRHPFSQRNQKINAVDIRISSYCVYGNRVFVDKAGQILVFDKNGEILYKINPEYEPVKITEKDRQKYLEFWKFDLKAEYEVFKDRLEFPEYFPAIRDFQVADGRIYVVSFRECKGENELFIFDVKGTLLKKALVPLADTNMILPHLFNYYRFKNKKLYILTENEKKDTWELKILNID